MRPKQVTPIDGGKRKGEPGAKRVKGADKATGLAARKSPVRTAIVDPDSLVFEDFLDELSMTFVGVLADKIDSEIQRWLGRAGQALGFEQASLAEIDIADGMLYASHQWCREGS